MRLSILLPFGTFLEPTPVSRIVAESIGGAFGILPHRLDCVAVLIAGILIYDISSAARCYVAVDAGTLIKTGSEVVVAVRHASSSSDLSRLRRQVAVESRQFAEDQSQERRASARLDHEVMRHLAEISHGS
jgi:F-type H+-transporting ATPase subunit epsilon